MSNETSTSTSCNETKLRHRRCLVLLLHPCLLAYVRISDTTMKGNATSRKSGHAFAVNSTNTFNSCNFVLIAWRQSKINLIWSVLYVPVDFDKPRKWKLRNRSKGFDCYKKRSASTLLTFFTMTRASHSVEALQKRWKNFKQRIRAKKKKMALCVYI